MIPLSLKYTAATQQMNTTLRHLVRADKEHHAVRFEKQALVRNRLEFCAIFLSSATLCDVEHRTGTFFIFSLSGAYTLMMLNS